MALKGHGFSIISYTGTGSAGTVAHGLGVIPQFIYVKRRNGSQASVIYLKHTDDGGTDGHLGYFHFEGQQDFADLASIFNDTAPTSTVFSVGSAANSGASGGKLLGAGGGGFILFYCKKNKQKFLKKKLNKFTSLNFKFINSGSEIIENEI